MEGDVVADNWQAKRCGRAFLLSVTLDSTKAFLFVSLSLTSSYNFWNTCPGETWRMGETWLNFPNQIPPPLMDTQRRLLATIGK